MMSRYSNRQFYAIILILVSTFFLDPSTLVFGTNGTLWFGFCGICISIYFAYLLIMNGCIKKSKDIRICCLIPARYASSRLPGKPLLKINNKTIIQLTWEGCQNTKYINKNDIYVVTDDMRIKEEIESNDGNVIMVTEKCLNGTERICKALPKLQKDYDIVVNVQGDEPFIKSQHIDIAIKKMIDNMNNNNCVCSTLHYIIKNKDQVYDRSVCKMILDKNDNALYGSRAMIPHTKTGKYDKDTKYYGHIGLMIYKREYLYKYMKVNTMAQLAEDIEWLKIMEDGYSLISALVDQVEIGVNTMDDYQYLLEKYQNNRIQTREQ